MSIDLIDREDTMIQATMFNETANKWYPKVEENKVYIFANGKVGLANKKFSSIKNDYSLTFGLETEIQECGNDQGISSNGFSFTKIDMIKDLFANTTIDIIGVVMEAQPISSIKLKSGDSKERQAISIADESGVSITVTVWGDFCRTLNAKPGMIVAFKQCRVSDYSGKSLNASSTPTDIVLNAPHPRTAQIKKWYSSQTPEQIQQKIISLTESGGTGERQDSALTLQEMKLAAESNNDLKLGQKSAWYKVNCYIQWFVGSEG